MYVIILLSICALISLGLSIFFFRKHKKLMKVEFLIYSILLLLLFLMLIQMVLKYVL
ncbi:hypothetical protein AusDCA_1008 [Desulfitobacterium sp. AusDCA]